MIKTILLVILVNQTVWAGCPDSIQVITKGQVANCDGLLFSPEASKQVDENKQDLDYYKNLSEKLQIRKGYTDQEINILDQRLKLYVDQSQALAVQVNRNESDDKWQKIMYFGLGVFATGIALYGASKIPTR